MSLGHEESALDRLSSTLKQNTQDDLQSEQLKIQQEKNALLHRQNQLYIEDLLKSNPTQPIKIPELHISNTQAFRTNFLNKQFEPILQNRNTNVGNLMISIDETTKNLSKLGVIENCFVSLNQVPSRYLSNRSSIINVIPVFALFPTKKFFAKTGTNIGNGEGDGYIEFQYKNIFGGAENLSFDATVGTRTSTSYLLNYNSPILNNSNYISENLFYINSRKSDWLNNEQMIKGITNKVYTNFRDSNKLNFEMSFENYWRIIRNVNSKSLNVINQCGDDFKSSVIFNMKYDSRNNPFLPTNGLLFKYGIEFSGLFPRFNKSIYWKNGLELQYAHKIKNATSIIISSKAGLLYPLTHTSHIMDRFYIGGPNDIRSFTLNGLGPKDYQSSIGGDLFWGTGISIVNNLPGKYHDSGFKIHNFLNFGKLIPYDKQVNLAQNFKSLICEPSIGCGMGIIYNHPSARFELNFVLPLSIHENDSMRKGLQYGIGLSFM